MSIHLQRDLESLRKKILLLGSLVEETTTLAIDSLIGLRIDRLEDMLLMEQRIDEMEVEIEEDCLKVLALHQPVAVDLRFIIAVLKVGNDLERMGDLAQNIMERVAFLSRFSKMDVNLDFPTMADIVKRMLHQSLDALVNQNPQLADEVIAMDDQVDAINREMFVILQGVMMEHPEQVERAVSTLSASRHLERLADLTTNIAEYVIFMKRGTLVRHRFDRPPAH